MEWVLWTVIILLFLLSIGGVIIPVLPDTLFVWAGFLLYQFVLADVSLPASFWWGMGMITLLIIGSDYVANLVFVKKYGGSRWAMAGAIFGMIFAPFIMGPIGILIGPFVTVLIIELFRKKEFESALKVGMATIFALFSSTIVKIVLQLIMIIWFFIVI